MHNENRTSLWTRTDQNENKAEEQGKGMHTAGWRSLRQRGSKAVAHICTKFDKGNIHLVIRESAALIIHFSGSFSVSCPPHGNHTAAFDNDWRSWWEINSLYSTDKNHFASPSDMIGLCRHWIIPNRKPLQQMAARHCYIKGWNKWHLKQYRTTNSPTQKTNPKLYPAVFFRHLRK